jgi:hypothetical protein
VRPLSILATIFVFILGGCADEASALCQISVAESVQGSKTLSFLRYTEISKQDFTRDLQAKLDTVAGSTGKVSQSTAGNVVYTLLKGREISQFSKLEYQGTQPPQAVTYHCFEGVGGCSCLDLSKAGMRNG